MGSFWDRGDLPKPASEPSAELLRLRRLRALREAHQKECQDHALAALLEAEKQAARADGSHTCAGAAYAWTGIAHAWMALQDRELVILSDD